MSFSRLVDFAIETYLERVIEELLAAGFYWREKADVDFWRDRYSLRKRTSPFIINYYSKTQKNNEILLQYEEKTQIQQFPASEIDAA